jgi:fatty acid desaturase
MQRRSRRVLWLLLAAAAVFLGIGLLSLDPLSHAPRWPLQLPLPGSTLAGSVTAP